MSAWALRVRCAKVLYLRVLDEPIVSESHLVRERRFAVTCRADLALLFARRCDAEDFIRSCMDLIAWEHELLTPQEVDI